MATNIMATAMAARIVWNETRHNERMHLYDTQETSSSTPHNCAAGNKLVNAELGGCPTTSPAAFATTPSPLYPSKSDTLPFFLCQSHPLTPDDLPHFYAHSNLFTVLAENGRLGQTEKVIEGFQELMTAYRGEVEVTVTSATALDKSTVSRIESALKGSQIAAKGNGKSLKIVQKVNPAIQGGLVVDFAGNTVDLSVASKVNKLNALLEQGV
uniref:Probable ATP5-F1F0-ATPase complex, OSCP subunit n=1 Tax=Melanopsichium pennsylvanicum 4 TaxID=1398559 RepID=A0A077R7D9_9BASI|nr:probable ATP5-F1F0-ATPase complex, OSCP subunit [Melanopsichium pennsylvanicum 4]